MSAERMREEFEKWWEEVGASSFLMAKDDAWECWKDSRAALVVELPVKYVLPASMDIQTLADACRDQDAAAIEAAGVKVKP